MRWLPARLKESQIQRMNTGQVVEEMRIDEKYVGSWYLVLAFVLVGQVANLVQAPDFSLFHPDLVGSLFLIVSMFGIGLFVVPFLTKQTKILRKRLSSSRQAKAYHRVTPPRG